MGCWRSAQRSWEDNNGTSIDRNLKLRKYFDIGQANYYMEAIFWCVHPPMKQLVPKANSKGSLSRTVCSHTYLLSLRSHPHPLGNSLRSRTPTRDTPPSTASLHDSSDSSASFSGVSSLRSGLFYSYSPDSVLPAVTAVWQLRQVTTLNPRTASLTNRPGHLFAAKSPPKAIAPRLSRSHGSKFPGPFKSFSLPQTPNPVAKFCQISVSTSALSSFLHSHHSSPLAAPAASCPGGPLLTFSPPPAQPILPTSSEASSAHLMPTLHTFSKTLRPQALCPSFLSFLFKDKRK